MLFRMDDENNYMELQVTGQDLGIIIYRIKKTTSLGRLKKSIEKRWGAPGVSLEFRFGSIHIKDEDSPCSLAMDDGDTIGNTDIWQKSSLSQ